MYRYLLVVIFAAIFCSACNTKTTNEIELAGEWQFKIDNSDVGEKEQWFNQDFEEIVHLPGSMVENGKGFDITMETQWIGGVMNKEWYKHPFYAPYHDDNNVRFPFWLQPEKKYTGAAWYKKTLTVPDNWAGKPVFINLERPHWESVVWVNGQKVGLQNSLATPHVYGITEFLKPGENSITIRIDNRIKNFDVGENSHSISDHTQSNWNGIVGDLSLSVKNEIFVERTDIFPNAETKSIEVKLSVLNTSEKEENISIPVFAQLKNGDASTAKENYMFSVDPGKNMLSFNYKLGDDALLWDEFNPNVYNLVLELKSEFGTEKIAEVFGLRDFAVDGTRFTINNRPVFLRGTLECAIFPKTGYPPTEIAGWEKVYSAVKAHGLNHVRFHSWCPPKAAFDAADKMGIFLQVECSSWANQSTELGSGFGVDQYIWDESKRIVKAYGNHPSFVMMAYGNEPGGPNYKEYLSEFVNYWKETDNRRLYTSAAGWPAIAANQYHNLPDARIQAWGQGLNSMINNEPPTTNFDWTNKMPKDDKPVVSHEIGQWCVYPNFKEIEKYTGVLKAKNFDFFRESLNAHNMGHLADSFLLASGKLQALCYKADIEAALRTPGFGGFQLLDLHDFPGQGTALVGVLDPFWEEKGYISPEEYSRFCNATVPLARLDKRVFKEGETMTAAIEVAHFGEFALDGVNPTWEITDQGNVVANGTFGQRDIEIGNGISLGQLNYQFQKENNARKLTLTVSVEGFSNHWDIWVYPEISAVENDEILVSESLDNKTLQYLTNGGKVLLSLGKGKVASAMGGDVGVGFSSIFWNTAWTSNQKPHTLGILCNPAHPALEYFPSEYHSNWQWWDAMHHADAIQLDSFSAELKPIVRIIDDWVSNRRLALLLEAQVGKGKILISGTDLKNDLENRPEAQQLLFSLKKYMLAEEFKPANELKKEELLSILK